MKMKIHVRRSCISLIVLSALVEAIRANENETSTAEDRQGRVNGRIVKLYSGYKPDPVLCIEEGFKADPLQCSVFYRCLKSSSGKFTVFKFQCGPGTVYDPETEICNHPGSTKRSECGGMKSNVEQDNENYIDQHELPSPISTIVPIYTSAASNVTGYTSYKVPSPSSSDVPSIANGYVNNIATSSTPYYIGSTSEKVQDITHNQVTHLWTDKNMIQSKITSSTTIFPVLEKNQPCTLDGFMGDRENCKKFYRCISNLRGGFIRYEFICSETTVWDDHMQSCNHPWAVRSKRCGRGGISNEKNKQISHISTEQMGVSYGIKLPETLNQENNDISVLKQPPVTYGNKLNNEYEYNLEKNQISYGPPLSNDKRIENEANIQLDKINDDFNFGQKINVQSTYSTTKLAENSVTPHTEIRQNFICTQSGFVGDYTDCKKFYRCVENGRGTFTKYEFTCSQGTVWDKKLEACNYGWAVKECGGTLTTDSIITGGSLASSTSASTTILNENVENGYVNHLSQQYETPSTVTVSTPVTLMSTTAASNQKGEECTETGFVGDKNDCKKFYRCVDNGRGTFTKYEYKCGDGTLWDQNIEACNHAWAVQSCNSPSSNDSMHTTSEATIKTHSTTVLIQSTTTEQLENSNYYNNAYGPQLDANIPPNPEIDLHETTNAPMINQRNDCDSTGFRGDSNDCKKFYRCVDNGQRGFIKYEFSCGEGTVWDPEIEACNHAWAVKHCGSSIPLKDEVTMSSTDNTHSSKNTHDLVVTTAISSMKPATQQNEIIDYDSGYGQQPIESTKIPYVKLETTTLKQTIGKINNSCQSVGFIGDINDCNKFYRCVDNGNGGFIRHEFSCGEGTVWDPEIEACNHVWAAQHCGGSISSTENLLTSSTTHLNVVESNNGYVTHNYIDSQSNSENIGETTTLPSSTSTVTTITNTRNECKSSGFMGDNSDCHKFYRCVDNGNGGFIKHDYICGEGTVWDSRIEACNHKWAVEKCGGNSYNEFVETTTTATSLQPTSPVTESVPTSTLSVIYSSSTTTTTTNTLPSHVDRECSSEGYFASPHDCKKFYRCVNEGKDGYTKYEFSCAEGTAWDVKIQSCNYISQVEACHVNQHPINTTETKPIHEPIYDEQIMESDTTKSTTSASTTSTSSTMSTSTASSSTTLSSTTSASTSKNPKPAGQNTCKDEGYFGDTNDCKKFYRCVYESNEVYTKYDFTCGDGTIWDQDIIACNHPRDVKNPSCKSETESTSPISTSSTSSATTDNIETPSSTTTNKPSTSTVAATKNDTNSSCTNSTSENSTSQNFTCYKAGFYADPSDCKKFYRCVDWENNGKKFSIYHFDCADGTIWDPALETCNHEDSVYPPRNCNNTQEQNQNISETPSTTEPITTTTKQTESATTSSAPCTTKTQCTTTSEYSSTQTTQSSTTDGSTTQSSITEESTTQSSTTEESTTQSSTTEESTTQTSTTQSPTTEESTTQTSTTQSSTTEESTTQTSTTQSPTTEESTTQTSTTQSPTTEESTTQTSTTQSSTTEESTTQTSTTQSTTTEESTTQTSTTQSPTTEESTTQTSTTQSSTTEESTTQTSTTQSSTTEESTTQTSTTQSSTTEESTTQTSTTQSSTTEESTTHSSTTEESTTQSSTTKEPATEESTTSTTNEQTTTTTQMTTSATDQTSTTTEPSTTTVEGSSSSTTESNQESTTESSSKNECLDTADGQHLYVCPTSFKRHPKYCNLFYQCTEDKDSHELKIAVFRCPNNTIYDENKIQCLADNKSSKKCNGQISQKPSPKQLGATHTEPFVVTKESMACQKSGHFPFEKNTECSSSLLKCELTKSGTLRGFVYRCPDGFVYWNISRRCEPIRKVRDCKGSSYSWKRRYDIPLERFNIAS